MHLSEAISQVGYLIAFHNKEVERAENNPYVQVTTKMITMGEWEATAPDVIWL
jgi:hypothetical protein